MKTAKSVFVCTECGQSSSKWLGRCPACTAWNSFEEQAMSAEPTKKNRSAPLAPTSPAVRFEELEMPAYMRSTTGSTELDRVLGGGVVQGSVVLLSGEPGIGKSTLLLQISANLAQHKKVLYVSGEESRSQLKLRYQRLGIRAENIWLLTETNTDAILSECERVAPDMVVIDSVQVLYSDRFQSAPGSITQVKEGAMAMITYAKNSGAAVFLVGHVNKEGGISGPKVLEHMVDAVLYFEGERTHAYRIIRAIKNRYGSTNEIGVFEMSDKGLMEIPNPSEMMMAERLLHVAGSCACCMMEGSRPLFTEIQALVSFTTYASPRRTADGFDYNRMCLLLAVLERRLRKLQYSQRDVYLNIAGGFSLDEPAVDLAVATALISGYTDRPVPSDLIAVGEVGLAGEVRAVSHIEQRVKEAVRLGFRKILIPKRNKSKLVLPIPPEVSMLGISSIYEIGAVLESPPDSPS